MTQWISVAPDNASLQGAGSPTLPSGLENNAFAATETSCLNPWRKPLDTLDQISRLQDDWDDDGAVAPSPQLVASTRELLHDLRGRQFPAPTRVGAGPNGTILLEWQKDLNYFEIEVCAPYRLEWMLALPDEKPLHGRELDEKALPYLLSF
jgi:hypothetical protein